MTQPGSVEQPAERVVIAGAGGFMGRYLADRFRRDGALVVTVGRSGSDITWGDAAALTQAVDGADVVLNLAGKSVNCRYNEANKAEIMRSRVATTAELGEAIAAAVIPPTLWFNASTATIYRHADDRPQTDESGEIGSGFSVDVATAWEREFFNHARAGTRQIALRMAIVLGDGPALGMLVRLARLGLGGPQIGGKTAGGRQMFSWVHIDDVYRAIRFIQTDAAMSGPVNVAAPGPVTNRELMATLRRIVGAKVGLPAYRWMLELGAVTLRTETELLLKSRWVLPTKLQGAGFGFEHPELEAAVRSIVGKS